jgi:hypothetical protein
MADIMKRISEEDHERVRSNGATALLVKPARFLLAGMEVQQKQCVAGIRHCDSANISFFRMAIALEAKCRTKTTIQATKLQRKRTLLLGKILALQDIQDTYMPGLMHWLSQQNEPILLVTI